MHILISERDERTAHLIGAKVEGMGHKVRYEPDKKVMNDLIVRETFDIIIVDPSPYNDAKPIIVNIRKAARKNTPYIMLLSDQLDQKDAIAAGANDVLVKPIAPQDVALRIEDAERFNQVVDWIGDSSEDFPSAGGIIAKSAFNQLFLSAIDRSARYGEKSYVLFIAIDNYDEILSMDGPYSANSSAAKLAQHLVKIRRQSDILAQVGKSAYALLLQRPVYETEPMDAANRFAESSAHIDGIEETGAQGLKFSVKLIDVPTGMEHVRHDIDLDIRT